MVTKEFFAELFSGLEQPHKDWKERAKHLCWLWLLTLVVNTIILIGYIEVGHDKGWPRAERWYERIHSIF